MLKKTLKYPWRLVEISALVVKICLCDDPCISGADLLLCKKTGRSL